MRSPLCTSSSYPLLENVECGPDDRIYYLLHIKPSKFDRVPVIPIGDGLGRVLAADLGQISKH